MIEINLLPEESKKKESRLSKIDLSNLDLANFPILKITSIFLGALVALHIILFSAGAYANARIKSLSTKYSMILPEKKEADLLKEQSEDINKKVAAIDALMVKRFSWAKKLNDLSDSITSGIWLSGLSYDEKLTEREVHVNNGGKGRKEPAKARTEKILVRFMTISGYASRMGEEGTALIGKFIKSLKDNSAFYSDFSDIELGSIKSEKIKDQEVMNFKITCFFRQ